MMEDEYHDERECLLGIIARWRWDVEPQPTEDEVERAFERLYVIGWSAP